MGPTDGRLERYALIVTGPGRADDADRLSTVGSAHERVPLGESAPLGYVPNVFWVPALEDRPPPPTPPADLTGLAACAVLWPRAAMHPGGRASTPPVSARRNPPEPRGPP